MLTTNEETLAPETLSARANAPNETKDVPRRSVGANAGRNRLAKMLSVEWLGQTVASVCWIASMLFYGVSSTGDWLQLMAASAWLLANVASIANTDAC